jgi:mono/diheme cytochrome c family protein
MRRSRVWLAGFLLTLSSPVCADEIAEGGPYYMRYCASCHGVEADGHGYVAPALVQPPSDLKHLGEGNAKSLLADRLAQFIDGRRMVIAHGGREMPVWGERLHAIEAEEMAGEKVVHHRVAAIVAYLLSIRAKVQP